MALNAVYATENEIGLNLLQVDSALPSTGVTIVSGIGIAQSNSTVGPTQTLGTQFQAAIGLVQYAVAGATVTAGNLVYFLNDATYSPNIPYSVQNATTALVGSSAPQFLGFALASATVGQFIWVWVGMGVYQGLCTTGISAGTVVTTHTVAGTVSTGGTTIIGLTPTATTTAAVCPLMATGILRVVG